MIYINLSVYSEKETIDFYAHKLGFFNYEARRLVCNMGVKLIVDLLEYDSDRHYEHFGSHDHLVSSFWIHVGDDSGEQEFHVIDNLVSKGVQFDEVCNLGGHYLNFIDPSGNKFCLHGHLGALK